MNASSDLCKTYALYFPAKRCCWVDPCSFVIQVHNISSDPSIFFHSVHVHIVWRDKILGWVIIGICIMLSYLIIGMEVENIYRREYRCDSFFIEASWNIFLTGVLFLPIGYSAGPTTHVPITLLSCGIIVVFFAHLLL